MNTTGRHIVCPVILAVPSKERRMRGKAQVDFLSRYARRALALSAAKSAVALGDLEKDTDGVPLPANGLYWSITHKPAYVGGVVAWTPIGMDVERVRPCSENLFKRVGDTREWSLAAADRDRVFFRYWTAKETVLKATGVGFKGFSRCRVAQVRDDYHLVIDFQNRQWNIEHCYFDGHIASVLSPNENVDWTILDDTLRPFAPERLKMSARGAGVDGRQ
jgi:4'-phosphopantetheinyl transferase